MDLGRYQSVWYAPSHHFDYAVSFRLALDYAGEKQKALKEYRKLLPLKRAVKGKLHADTLATENEIQKLGEMLG